MSHWRCLLKDMAELGGEGIRASEIPGWGVTCETHRARKDLLSRGLIRPVGRWMHSITQKGWRVAAGAADFVDPRTPGKRGQAPHVYSLVVRGPQVSDIVIEDLLIDSGLRPGAPISPEIIRAYSAKLAAVVRASA
jgi:hypothetical protein